MKAETDAAVAALQAAWPIGRVYRVGDVPSNPVTPYVVLGVDSGASVTRRHASSGSSRLHRISAQSVGVDMAELTQAVEASTAAFLDKRLTVAGRATTPCREELAADPQRDPDGGALLYALQTFTFTTTPA